MSVFTSCCDVSPSWDPSIAAGAYIWDASLPSRALSVHIYYHILIPMNRHMFFYAVLCMSSLSFKYVLYSFSSLITACLAAYIPPSSLSHMPYTPPGPSNKQGHNLLVDPDRTQVNSSEQLRKKRSCTDAPAAPLRDSYKINILRTDKQGLAAKVPTLRTHTYN